MTDEAQDSANEDADSAREALIEAIADSLEGPAEEAPEPVEEPVTVAQVEPAPAAQPEASLAEASADEPGVAWWPFLVYLGLWLAFAGVIIWRFIQIPADMAVFDSPVYPMSVFGGLVLAIGGPLMALAAWFAAWGTPGSTKGGLLVSSLIRGSIATFGGVSIWWLALIIIDQLRTGRIL